MELIDATQARDIICKRVSIKKLHPQTFARYRDMGFFEIKNKGMYAKSDILSSIERILEHRAKGRERNSKKDFKIESGKGCNLFLTLMNKALTN